MIRCLLIIPFPESSLNDEAGKLFMDSFEEFAKRARLMTSVHAIPVVKAPSPTNNTTNVVVTSKVTSKPSQENLDSLENKSNNNTKPTEISENTSNSTHNTVFSVLDMNKQSNSAGEEIKKPTQQTVLKDVNKKKSLKRL